MRLPQTPEDFRKMGYLIGCLVGDGYIAEGLLHNNDKEVIDTYVKYMKKVFGLEAKIIQGRTCKIIRSTGGKTFVRFLTDILDLPTKDKSANVKIPPIITFYRPMLISFIEGWFDTDGYVSYLNHSIEFTSKSSQLVKQAGVYLLQFGIHSVIFQKGGFHYLRIANKPYLKIFSKVFTSCIRKKKERIKTATRYSSTSRIFDKTPLSGKMFSHISYSNKKLPYFNKYKSYKNLSRPFLQKLISLEDFDFGKKDLQAVCNTNVSCVKVKSIKLVKSKEKYVYDFTIPGTHNFVAGRILVHNTTLLDKIRQTNVVAKEFGGITQHIGAYQVGVKERESGRTKKITFIDTPGHAAFSKMRSRGARVADLAILVVAADEGVKPQTLESLKYINQAKIPYLVAINKTDLPNINLDKVKKGLAEEGILVEGHGGDIVSLPVSAKTGKGLDELLEMLLLLAEMQELKGEAKAELEAVVIESKLDSRRGPLATVLVRNGSLKVGDQIEAESAFAKIKAMFDENGQPVNLAGPGKPVEVLGFKTVPPIGTPVKRVKEKIVSPTEKPEPRLAKKKESEERKLRLIVKADVAGTLEAILAGLPQELEVIDSGVGEINESDVLLAETTGAEIIAFNVKTPARVKKLAETEKVKINSYQVIYELFEEIEKKVKRFVEPSAGEEVLGKAEILKEFEIKKEKIAGCRVMEGEIKKTDKLHLMRQDKLIGNCRIKSMKRGKLDIDQAKAGEEFGAILSPRLDFRLGDMLVSYRKVEE